MEGTAVRNLHGNENQVQFAIYMVRTIRSISVPDCKEHEYEWTRILISNKETEHGP